jgi:hypothetical protein
MRQVHVIGEDALTCALGTRMVVEATGKSPAMPIINTRGVTKLQADLRRYFGLVSMGPVLCLADTDGACAKDMLARWLPRGAPHGFSLRFAVTEAESWVLADSEALADFLHVSRAKMPDNPDELADPKRQILALAARSSKRLLRQELISERDSSKPGTGYNVHLCDFAARYWRPSEASRASPSLSRAMIRLAELAVA